MNAALPPWLIIVNRLDVSFIYGIEGLTSKIQPILSVIAWPTQAALIFGCENTKNMFGSET